MEQYAELINQSVADDSQQESQVRSLHSKTGSRNYRAFVGPPEKYDLVASMQFNLLTLFGLREYHYLLDIGCGSLRAGKLFIPYLLSGRYYGIEPEKWLVEEGIKHELGKEIVSLKRPSFSNDPDFNLSAFDQKFDFIIAQSIFSHAAPQQIRKCLSEAHKVLVPNGIFAFTFKQGSENYTGDEWCYPGCIQYTPQFIRDLVVESGLHFELINWQHPNYQKWAVAVRSESVRAQSNRV